MKNKKILAIDTSDHVCSVSISYKDNRVSKSVGNKLNHSKTLMPLIESAFLEVPFEVADVDYILVTDGPGSFTGIRIGVATAKALAHFTDTKIITVKSLMTIASYVPKNSDKIIVPLIDARRKTYYTTFFDNSTHNQLIDIEHLAIDEIIDRLSKYNKEIVLVGDNLNISLKDIPLTNNISILDITNETDRASNMIDLIDVVLENEQNIKNYKTAEPFYLKKSQAEREYDEKHGVK